MNRRELLRLLVAAPAAAGFAWTDAEAQQAGRLAQAAREEAVTTESEEHARARGSGAEGAGEGNDNHTEVYGVGHDRPDVAT